MEEPPVVRLRDKMSFTLGVIGCALIEFVVLCYPEHYPLTYVAFATSLISLRFYIYYALEWHLFLADFCYFSNLCCLLQVAFPQSQLLLIVNFAHTMGPLTIAIITWRNSLVFHSLDKITSVFIHGAPSLLTFCFRWYPSAGTPALPETIPFSTFFAHGLLMYIAWQVFYLAVTEVLYGRTLAAKPDMATSIRWLTAPPTPGHPYTGITLLAYKGMRRCGVMRSGEIFDSEAWKTKFIFMFVQLVYTAATFLPVAVLWSHKALNAIYLLTVYALCVWNGGSYYIEVFSKAYRKQFEGDAATRRALAIESLGAPKRDAKPSDAKPAAERGEVGGDADGGGEMLAESKKEQ